MLISSDREPAGFRDVERLVAEAIGQEHEVQLRPRGAHGGDLFVDDLKCVAEVRSVNMSVSAVGDFLFVDPDADECLPLHRQKASERYGPEGRVVVLGVAHDGRLVIGTGALDADEYAAQVASERREAGTRILRAVRVSEMHQIANYLPGVVILPGTSVVSKVSAGD